MKDSKYKQAKKIRKWKDEIRLHWGKLEVVSVKVPDSSEKPMNLGDKFVAEVVINTNDIPIENIGVDVVFGHKKNDVVSEIVRSERMKVNGKTGNNARFTCAITLSGSGVYDYAFRIFPIADFLPHQQDFNLVKWV